jgi:hypothetical protein
VFRSLVVGENIMIPTGVVSDVPLPRSERGDLIGYW